MGSEWGMVSVGRGCGRLRVGVVLGLLLVGDVSMEMKFSQDLLLPVIRSEKTKKSVVVVVVGVWRRCLEIEVNPKLYV